MRVPGCGHAVGKGGIFEDKNVGGGAEAEDGGGGEEFIFADWAEIFGVACSLQCLLAFVFVEE